MIRRRGAAEADSPRRFAAGINCTGPLHDIRHSRDPMLRGLLDAGLAEPDHLGIGLKVDDERAGGRRANGCGRWDRWARRAIGKLSRCPISGCRRQQVADDIAKELEHGAVDPEDGDLVAPDPKIAVPDEVAEAVRTMIRWAGDDPDREGLLDTPARVARAWKEYARGYAEDPAVHLSRTFEEVGGYDEIVLLQGHSVPVALRASPGADHRQGRDRLSAARPGGRNLQACAGATWIRPAPAGAGTADRAGRRLHLASISQPKGVAVVIEASHACMTARGVGTPGVMMTTSRMMGTFRERRAQPPRSPCADGILTRPD